MILNAKEAIDKLAGEGRAAKADPTAKFATDMGNNLEFFIGPAAFVLEQTGQTQRFSQWLYQNDNTVDMVVQGGLGLTAAVATFTGAGAPVALAALSALAAWKTARGSYGANFTSNP